MTRIESRSPILQSIGQRRRQVRVFARVSNRRNVVAFLPRPKRKKWSLRAAAEALFGRAA
jgi:hypothetical protein